ncbi:MAG: glycosyltransferase [Candidatus Komeilibacteria bacterium]|nr:glycosyltransferase [Candidatus Komeilibacteria bacterium]
MTLKRICFFLLWLFLTALLVPQVKLEAVSLLFAVSTFLLYSHVLYDGYFLFKKDGLTNPVLFSLAALIYVYLIELTQSVGQVFSWYLILICLFVLALIFFIAYKFYSQDTYFKEVCNFKIYIEFLAIIAGGLALAVYPLLKENLWLLGAATVFVVIKLNWFILFKKRIYQAAYPIEETFGQPTVSVVIIAYNEENHITQSLKAIQNQTYRPSDVILVDDHSQDQTVPLAKKFEALLPLKIVQKAKRGISRSRNFGAREAQGELILFLDADIFLPPDFLALAVEEFKRQHLAIAGFDFYINASDKIDIWINNFHRRWFQLVQYFNPRALGGCLLVKNKLHQRVLFNEDIIMLEDFDYVNRFSHYGKFRIIGQTRALVSWRRFQKENRLKLVLKFLIFEFYRQNVGEIEKPFLSYKYGNSDELTD